MPYKQVTFEELQRVHQLVKEQFPHEYLDEGLGAVGLFLQNPPKNAGYRSTPLNTVTFAGIGVDGIHFGSLTDHSTLVPESPVVVTIPMEIDHPNFIVGESLYDFLCFGCQHGFAELGNLHLNMSEVLDYYSKPPVDWFDDRAPGILALLTSELSLSPWEDLPSHFDDLQSRYLPSLKLGDASSQ